MPVATDRPGHELGIAALGGAELNRVTSRAVGRDVVVDGLTSTEIPYDYGSPATAGIWRVDVAHRSDGETGTYSFFVKLLRHPRLWPGLSFIPAGPFREDFVANFPWRFEVDIHLAGIAGLLPDGMRSPALHHVEVIDEEHLVLWSEFVDIRSEIWDLGEFENAAYLLGRLAARRREGQPANEAMPVVSHIEGRGAALRYFAERRVLGSLAPLRDPDFWRQPLLATALERTGETELAADMLRLADRIPDVLDKLDLLPQTFAHGDASPQNLLTPADNPDQILVIDWGFGTLLAVGHDLGQLLVGLAHAGTLAASELPAIHQAILPAYCRGLAEEGFEVPADDVRFGYLGTLAARSALVSLPFEVLSQDPRDDLVDLMVSRIELTRMLLTLCGEVI